MKKKRKNARNEYYYSIIRIDFNTISSIILSRSRWHGTIIKPTGFLFSCRYIRWLCTCQLQNQIFIISTLNFVCVFWRVKLCLCNLHKSHVLQSESDDGERGRWMVMHNTPLYRERETLGLSKHISDVSDASQRDVSSKFRERKEIFVWTELLQRISRCLTPFGTKTYTTNNERLEIVKEKKFFWSEMEFLIERWGCISTKKKSFFD